MHLLIDIQALQTEDSRLRGIGRYSRNLVRGLAAARPGWRIELVQSTHLAPADSTGLEDLPCLWFTPPFPVDPQKRLANDQYYADWLTARGADAILLCSAIEYRAVVPEFIGPRPPLFGVLYDLIPLQFHQHYLSDATTCGIYARGLRQLLQADCLLAISQATADDACRLFALPRPRIVSISGACDPEFAPLAPGDFDSYRADLRAKHGLERDFVLYVGGFDHRKNMAGAMRAFAALPPAARADLDLVIACKLTPAERSQLEGVGRDLGIGASLKLTGFVTDEELRALYQLCRLFFFPSLYEGLGLPVLEALRCGAPVVASDRSSIPEFAGPHSWLADPETPAAMAEAMLAALAEPRDARRQERCRFAEGFRWEEVAARACREIEDGAAPRLSPARRRRRVAWVSPLPPSRSGIADYSDDLLQHLGDRCSIELVIDPRALPVTRELSARYPVLASTEVPARHRAHPYDLFVYHVGNSHFHLYMLDLLWRYPGLVVLHDLNLTGLALTALQQGVWPGTLRQELQREGAEAVADHVEEAGLDWEYLRAHATLNGRILQAALGVIVHSHSSWREVRRHVDVPVARVPMAVSLPALRSPAEERASLGLPADAFVICTLGLVGPTKRLPSLLRAVAALPPSIRANTVLAVVGDNSLQQKIAVRELAEVLGIGPLLRWGGRVPLRQLPSYARAADVCVQLRYPTSGETSAALLREMAAGAACIVSDLGPMAELPDDAVLKVRTPAHEVEDLVAALTRLHDDPGARAALAQGALRFMREKHALADALERYQVMIEMTAAHRADTDRLWTEHAADALAAVAGGQEVGDTLADWTRLRCRGQQLLAAPAAFAGQARSGCA